MRLSEVIRGVTVSKMYYLIYGQMTPTQELEIQSVSYDSRNISRGGLFVAIRGTAADGHKFVGDAIDRGAGCVIMEDDSLLPDSFFLHKGAMKIVVPDSRIALAQVSSNYFGNPSEKLKMIGVTGTNGKTTTAHLVKSIMDSAGRKTGLIGTIDYQIGEKKFPATHTTPESLELHGLFRKMVEENCEFAVMEVSSHALDQRRVYGIDYSAAVFMNLTQDHLDYHVSMQNYFDAKALLFGALGPGSCAIISADDEWGEKLRARTRAKITTFGVAEFSDVRAVEIKLRTDGSSFTLLDRGNRVDIETKLTGKFNITNTLAAYATCRSVGLDSGEIQRALKAVPPVRGRFEQVNSPKGWTAVIDYAHTHDALEKVLTAIKNLYDGPFVGRIITVFGCGGDRDRGKRVKMAEVATRLSDVTIITSDNPRTEDPEKIIDDVMAGANPKSTVIRIADRKEAIRKAVGFARKGDVLLIAGKGHEEYQIIGKEKIPFSDKGVVVSLINSDL